MSERPGLPRLTALAFTSITGCALRSNDPLLTARCRPGPRPVRRATSANGSARSDQLARHRLLPPLMLLADSMFASGNSVTNREGIEDVHWPYMRRLAAWRMMQRLRARVIAT